MDGGKGGWFTTSQPIETNTGTHEIGHGYGHGHTHGSDIMTPLIETQDKGASRKVTPEQVYSILAGGFIKGMRRIGKATNPIFNTAGNQVNGNTKLSNDSK